MKMCGVNIKIWIVLLICHAVNCQMVEYYGRGRPEGIMFPGPINDYTNENEKYNPVRLQPTCSNCGRSRSMTLENDWELEELDSYDEILKYLDDKFGAGRVSVGTRIKDEQERSVPVQQPSHNCLPENKIVSFETDSSFEYHPSCTRVKRCSGCCSSPHKSCQPINETITNFRVWKIDIATKEVSELIIPVIEHLSCQCQCTQKPDACPVKHVYDPKKCLCQCRNAEDAKKCPKNRFKRWDATNCACVCRNIEECHTGLQFNEETCSCEPPEQGNNINQFPTRLRNNNTLWQYPSILETKPSEMSPRRRHKDED